MKKTSSLQSLNLQAVGLSVAAIFSLGSPGAQAASATWNAAPTNGIWEAIGIENNWSTGATTFPGSILAASTDIATFSVDSSTTTVSINATVPNSFSLFLGGITFDGSALTNSYTIGSTSGNSLTVPTNTDTNTATNQILMGTRTGAGTATTQTVNAPIVITPASASTAGYYTIQNNSTLSGDALVIGGAITGGTTTSSSVLTLRGTNTNVANVVSGVVSGGGAAAMGISKRDAGTWTMSGNNTLSTNVSFNGGFPTTSGPVIDVEGGTLRLTGNNTLSTTGSATGNGNLFNIIAGGTLVLTGTNTISLAGTAGNAIVAAGSGATLSLNSFANNLGGLTGTAAKINLGGSAGAGRLLYTGTGETTSFSFGSTSGNAAGVAIIDQSGTGLLKITGNAASGSSGSTFQTFQLQGSTAGTGEFAGAITGSYNFIKTGTGTWTLSGTNTYTGTTSVTGGTLATGTTGNLMGNVTLTNTSGIILTLGNNASFADTALLTFGSLNVINLNFSGADTLTSITNGTSTLTGTGLTYTAAQLNTFFGGSSFSGTGSLTIVAVPEPSTTAAAIALGLATLIGFRIRRNRAMKIA